MDSRNMESFHTEEEAISRAYRQPTGGETSSTSYMSDKGLISRTHKGLQTLNIKEIKLPITKWANEGSRQFSKTKEHKWPITVFTSAQYP